MLVSFRPAAVVAAMAVCVVIAANTSWGQISFPSQLNNTPTPQHQPVSETRVSVVPPVGFQYDARRHIYVNGAQDMYIRITEFPVSFENARNNLLRSLNNLKSTSGMEVVGSSDVNINGLKGMVAKINFQVVDLTIPTYIMIFGKNETAVTITARAWRPLEADEDKAFSSALQSVLYDEQRELDPMITTPFSVDVSGTELKYFPGTPYMLYTHRGGDAVTHNDVSYMLLSRNISDKPIKDTRKYAIEISQSDDNFKIEVVSCTPVTLDGLQGQLLKGKGTLAENGKPFDYYGLFMFETDNTTVYLAESCIFEDGKGYSGNIETVLRTFKLKK